MNPLDLNKYNVVLGSGSPRRKSLLQEIIPTFTVKTSNADEEAPAHLNAQETALYVSRQKALDLLPKLQKNDLLITADTEVWLDQKRFGKPNNKAEAIGMLLSLSGKKHQVVSGFCIAHQERILCEAVTTQVYFKELALNEIEFYVDHYKPFDKAGAYGIQEWIGLVGIEKIEGSFFNVVGLPVFELNTALKKFVKNI